MDKKYLVPLSAVLAGLWLKGFELYAWALQGALTLGNLVNGLIMAILIPLLISSFVVLWGKEEVSVYVMGLINSFYFVSKGVINLLTQGITFVEIPSQSAIITTFYSFIQTTIEAFLIGFPVGVTTWMILNYVDE